MRSRAAELGGELSIQSDKKGARVLLTLPLQRG
jgi:signal transduction histidine kinase